MEQSTINSRIIAAPAAKIFKALTDPRAIERWQVPGEMTGRVSNFELKVGSSYSMSLFYPKGTEGMGKTAQGEDRFISRFLVIEEPYRLVQSVEFVTDDPAFSGKMKMEVVLAEIGDKTKVSFIFTDIPKGIAPSDNEQGTESSLEKLAQYVGG